MAILVDESGFIDRLEAAKMFDAFAQEDGEEANVMEVVTFAILSSATDVGERRRLLFDLFDFNRSGRLEKSGFIGLITSVAQGVTRFAGGESPAALSFMPPGTSSIHHRVVDLMICPTSRRDSSFSGGM